MKLSETTIPIGGNFRCCLESVTSEYLDKEVKVDSTSECKYCHTKFKLNENKIWERLENDL